MTTEVVLEGRGLTKAFGERIAVDRVDLVVRQGSVCGLLGRNGAGKTTLLRIVLGLLAPDAGLLRLFDRDAPAGDIEARHAMAGFVEEPRFYPYLSARRNLELLAMLDGPQAALPPEEALRLVDLESRRGDKVGSFSTGMRQRLGLAAALLRAPRLLVLDEPTIGLDPANAAAVRAQLRELAAQGVAVLVSSHNMTEVGEICDRIHIVHEGFTVWEGSNADLHAAAPAPAWRLRTSDDDRTVALAHRLGVGIDRHRSDQSALVIHGDDAMRDAFVLELARAGVAVRRLEPDVPPLDALFTSLTGAAKERNAA